MRTPEVEACRITAKTTPESNPSNVFASQGTAVLSSPRLLPLEASERFFRALPDDRVPNDRPSTI
jgi:hypothetical protein